MAAEQFDWDRMTSAFDLAHPGSNTTVVPSAAGVQKLVLLGVQPAVGLRQQTFDDVIAVHIPNVVIMSPPHTISLFHQLTVQLPLHLDDVSIQTTAPNEAAVSVVDAVRRSVVGATWTVVGRIVGDLSAQLAAGGLCDVRVEFAATVVRSAGDVDLHALIHQLVVRDPLRNTFDFGSASKYLLNSVIQRPAYPRPKRYDSFLKWYESHRPIIIVPTGPNGRLWPIDQQMNDELSVMTPQRRAELDAKYAAAVKAVEDYEKEEIQRIIDYGLRSADGMKPIGLAVVDETVKFSGKCRITSEVAVPMNGRLVSKGALIHSLRPVNEVIVFTADDAADLLSKTFNMEDALDVMLHRDLQSLPGFGSAYYRLCPEVRRHAQIDQVTLVPSLFRFSVLNDGNVYRDVPFRIGKLPLLSFLDCQADWILHLTHNSIQQSARAYFVWKWPADLKDIPSLVSDYLQRIRKEEERASIVEKKKTVITSAEYVGLKIAGAVDVDYNWNNYNMQPPLEILPELWDHWQQHRDAIESVQQSAPAADAQSTMTQFVRTFPFRQVVEQFLPAVKWKNNFPAAGGQISTHISTKLNLVAGVTVLGNRPAKLSFTQNTLTLRIGASHFAPITSEYRETFTLYRKSGAARTNAAAAVSMSLEEVFTAWNYAELLPLIPQQIKDKLRLSSPSLPHSPGSSRRNTQ